MFTNLLVDTKKNAGPSLIRSIMTGRGGLSPWASGKCPGAHCFRGPPSTFQDISEQG